MQGPAGVNDRPTSPDDDEYRRNMVTDSVRQRLDDRSWNIMMIHVCMMKTRTSWDVGTLSHDGHRCLMYHMCVLTSSPLFVALDDVESCSS